MKFIPILDQVIIKENITESKSQIMFPDGVKRDVLADAVVIAVGPGFITDTGVRAEMDVKVGDRIKFIRDQPGRITLQKPHNDKEGGVYRIVLNDIICKVQE